MADSTFFHGTLPDTSDLLVGRQPPTELAWRTDDLQIWFNNTDEKWQDPELHVHDESDEVFIVIDGELVVEVEGRQLGGSRGVLLLPQGDPSCGCGRDYSGGDFHDPGSLY